MPCYKPLHGYYNRATRKMHFCVIDHLEVAQYHDAIEEMSVPCGRCIGCRLEYSRKWAIRCCNEASLYNDNCFVTLTYDDKHLPSNKSLLKRDLQLFLKRLRKKFGEGIRFFACGEYGDETLRPHYHMILFNFSPRDFKPGREKLNLNPLNQNVDWSTICSTNSFSSCGNVSPSLSSDMSFVSSAVYSEQLYDIWKNGQVMVGEVTFESCAYVARYCMKKVKGKDAQAYYNGREPEFVLMSRRPGIGKHWIDKYLNETYIHDAVLSRGHFVTPPRFYDNQLMMVNPGLLEELKIKRRKYAKDKAKALTQERLNAICEVVTERQKKIVKKL